MGPNQLRDVGRVAGRLVAQRRAEHLRVSAPPVRRRRPADLPACVRLMGLVSAEARYPFRRPSSPRGWLAGPEVLDAWVAERAGEMLGHIALTRVGDADTPAYAWRELTGREPRELVAVSRLFVRAQARHEGLGGMLLDAATAEAAARGLRPVLQVVSNCTDAIRLYDERGWRLRSMDAWHGHPTLRLLRYEAPVGVG